MNTDQTESGKSTDVAPVKSTDKALRILDLLHRNDGGKVTELAKETGFSKGTVHKHLETLQRREFVVKDDGEYRISFKFLEYGGKTRQQVPLSNEVKKKVTELAEVTNEVAQFSILEYGKAVTLYREVGRQGVSTKIRVGKRLPVNQLAGGKAMLSQLPVDEVEEIIRVHGLPAATSNTITDPDKLLDELAEINDRGYAYNKEETIDGLMGVSVPVSPFEKDGGRVLGACTVSGPTHRIAGKPLNEELPHTLLSVVNELELNIKYR